MLEQKILKLIQVAFDEYPDFGWRCPICGGASEPWKDALEKVFAVCTCEKCGYVDDPEDN